MKKEGVFAYFIVVIIAIFTLTSFAYAEWVNDINTNDDSLGYYFENKTDIPIGIDYTNGVWESDGTDSFLEYVPFSSGSRERISSVEITNCGICCSSYGEFSNPSITKYGNKEPLVAYTYSTVENRKLLTFAGCTGENLVRNTDYQFKVRTRNSGVWIQSSSDYSGPDNPCFFDVPSITNRESTTINQRIVIASNKDYYAVYKSRDLTTIQLDGVHNSCNNKITDIKRLLSDGGSSMTDSELNGLLKLNSAERFNWGNGISVVKKIGNNPIVVEEVDASQIGFVDIPNIVLDSQEKPHIVYIKAILGNVKLYHAYYNTQGNWVYEEMRQVSRDGNSGIGDYHVDAISIAIDPATNKPAALYYQSAMISGGGQGKLIYVYHNGNQWVSELVTTNNIYYGVGYYPGYRQPSIDINKNGKARISYLDASGNLIYRERKSDGTWTSETIDSGIGNQKGSFIKVNRTNQVHIAQHKKHYYEYELPVAGNPEICGDGEDNDGNGFIDYRDPACTGSCILPNVIKNETGGTGAGAPWVPSVYNSSYAGCCLTSQCYYYVDSGDNGCVNADTGISKLVAGNLVNIYCEVNGTSAVWCKEGYANNGTGGCVLTTIEPICGDGNVDLGEECDDEDTDNGDGCSSICEKEDGWDCISEPSLCEYVGLEIRRTCNDITDQETCISYEDPSQLTDSMKQGIQEKSLISNNFCFDAIYTFEPDTFNGGIEGDANTCGTYIACSCYWNSATTSCEERTFRESTNPGLCTSTVIPLSTCIIDTDDSLYGSCIDGEDEYLINWTADWNGLGENTIEGCVSGEKMLPCPKSTNINFFNIINLIIAILIIIVIYLIISNRKKKSKNDGKTRKRGKK